MTKKLSLRQLFISLFLIIFAAYIIIGFQPAEAVANYRIYTTLVIPNLNLSSDVAKLTLEDRRLKTPDYIVGSFKRGQKTLLIGHATTAFQNLNLISINDEINYNEKTFRVKSKTIMLKTFINIDKLLLNDQTDPETLILMTCAGKDLGNGDSTHRLIVIAEEVQSFNNC